MQTLKSLGGGLLLLACAGLLTPGCGRKRSDHDSRPVPVGTVPASGTAAAPSSTTTAVPTLPSNAGTAVGSSSSATAPLPAVPATVRSIGNLNQPRALHSATPLANGDILIVGGMDAQGRGLAGAEIYRAGSGVFQVVPGVLRSPRLLHRASVLGNGRVLISGGGESLSGDPLKTTEMFDPANGQFSPGPDLLEGRAGHVAQVYADAQGREHLLIAGGLGGSGLTRHGLSSAESIDIAALSSRALAPMLQDRFDAKLHDLGQGRMLIQGGLAGIVNGQIAAGQAAGCEIFRADTQDFVPGPALGTDRVENVLLGLSSGELLVLGGWNRAGQMLNDGELLQGGAFAPLSAQLSQGRMAATAVELPGGQVLIAGGSDATGALASCEILDLPQGGFAPTADLLQARFGHSALLVNGEVLVLGGVDAQGQPLAGCEAFALTAPTSVAVPPSTTTGTQPSGTSPSPAAPATSSTPTVSSTPVVTTTPTVTTTPIVTTTPTVTSTSVVTTTTPTPTTTTPTPFNNVAVTNGQTTSATPTHLPLPGPLPPRNASFSITVTKYPREVIAGESIRVQWKLQAAKRIAINHLRWGSDPAKLDRATPALASRLLLGLGDYYADIVAPSQPGTVHVQVHTRADGQDADSPVLAVKVKARPTVIVTQAPKTVNRTARFDVEFRVRGAQKVTQAWIMAGTRADQLMQRFMARPTGPMSFVAELNAGLFNGPEIHLRAQAQADGVIIAAAPRVVLRDGAAITIDVTRFPAFAYRGEAIEIQWRTYGIGPTATSVVRYGAAASKLDQVISSGGRGLLGLGNDRVRFSAPTNARQFAVYFRVEVTDGGRTVQSPIERIALKDREQLIVAPLPGNAKANATLTVKWEIKGGFKVQSTRLRSLQIAAGPLGLVQAALNPALYPAGSSQSGAPGPYSVTIKMPAKGALKFYVEAEVDGVKHKTPIFEVKVL